MLEEAKNSNIVINDELISKANQLSNTPSSSQNQNGKVSGSGALETTSTGTKNPSGSDNSGASGRSETETRKASSDPECAAKFGQGYKYDEVMEECINE